MEVLVTGGRGERDVFNINRRRSDGRVAGLPDTTYEAHLQIVDGDVVVSDSWSWCKNDHLDNPSQKAPCIIIV